MFTVIFTIVVMILTATATAGSVNQKHTLEKAQVQNTKVNNMGTLKASSDTDSAQESIDDVNDVHDQISVSNN